MANIDAHLIWREAFPTIGKGTFLYNINRGKPIYIRVHDKTCMSSIFLSVGADEATFITSEGVKDRKRTQDVGYNVGYVPDKIVTYWFSYDSDNMTIKYGKGYCMEETTILNYTFADPCDKETYFDPTKKRIVEVYHSDIWNPIPSTIFDFDRIVAAWATAAAPPPQLEEVQDVYMFSPYPFLCNRPPVVRDSSTVNMFDLDSGKYTYSGSLPPACKDLYDNITGPNMSFEYGEREYKLADAIRHSIKDKNGILHKTLRDKEGELGPEREVYLRVTLGKKFGNSPGTPYVLEIWPVNCGSPIHNHGNACAVIRVVYGGLTVGIYNKHSEVDNPKPIVEFDVVKDDVTWIAPNWYQTHKLWNNTDDFCATIQCYQYGTTDDMHWPYFDYIKTEDGTSSIDSFVPDSDFHFNEFYDKVMTEYEHYMKTA